MKSELRIELPDKIAEWRLEHELTYQTPRQVVHQGSGSYKAFIVLLIFVLAAGFFFGGDF